MAFERGAMDGSTGEPPTIVAGKRVTRSAFAGNSGGTELNEAIPLLAAMEQRRAGGFV